MMLGGAPFLGGGDDGGMSFSPTVISVAFGMGLIGTAGGLCFVPGNALAIMGARAAGYSLEQVASALTAGFNMAFALGNIAGPLLGGALVGRFGFRWSCTGLGLSLVIVCALLLPLLYYRRCTRIAKSSSATTVVVADHERSAALLDRRNLDDPQALAAARGRGVAAAHRLGQDRRRRGPPHRRR